jgi:hypothetical protein
MAPPPTIFRRQSSLKISSYQTTSITKHYALNNQILAAFESHYENKLYQVAYAIGLKFAETALLEIPKHGYFYSSRHNPERVQSSLDAIRVTHILQELLLQIQNGGEEEALQKNYNPELKKVEKLQFLAMEQCQGASSPGDYENERCTIEAELDQLYHESILAAEQQQQNNGSTGTGTTPFYSSSFTSSVLACGDNLSSVLCPPSMNNQMPGPPPPLQRTNSSLNDLDLQRALFLSGLAPTHSTTLLPPPPIALERNRSHSHSSSMNDVDLQRALFLSGLEVQPHAGVAMGVIAEDTLISGRESSPSTPDSDSPLGGGSVVGDSVSAQHPRKPSGARRESSGAMGGISIRMIMLCYHEDFDGLQAMGRVRISQVPTFQGRIPDSTNGCTVIAPLLCIHHFYNERMIPDPGLPDQIILEVIDEETPNILPQVREVLGLKKDAFLIPSDAHDYLMEQQYMCAEQFVDICGGNILDAAHVQPLVDCLIKVGGKKLAATLFFHEHVITILQLRQSAPPPSSQVVNPTAPKVWFDVIDSLPHEKTLSRMISDTDTAKSQQEYRSSASSVATSEYFNSERKSSFERSSFLSERSSSSGTALAGAAGGIAIDAATSNAPTTTTIVDLLPEEYYTAQEDEFEQLGEFERRPEIRPNASRIRCMDEESLKATLMWYACSVFTEENKTYVDMYKWDDKISDVDPRVFQAFIWREA